MCLVDSTRLTLHTVVRPGDTVLVAVSGGQDSCALIHALASLRQELGISLHAAHLNHGFRGAEAAMDACFVASFAERLGVPCGLGSVDTPSAARRRHISKQEAARDLRARFLSRVADEVSADWIALGHTRDDHVETVLLNILRGTGIDGLRGLAAVSGRIVRPLLGVTREETAAYCAVQDIAFREDASNHSLAYRRNRVREELLPELAAYYNPAIREALARLAALATDESDFMDSEALRALTSASVGGVGGIELDQSLLAAMHVAVRRRVIRRAIAEVRGDLHGIDASVVESLMYALESEAYGPRFEVTLPRADVIVSLSKGKLAILPHRAPAASLPVESEIPIPGRHRVSELGLVVVTALEDVPASLPARDAPRAVLDRATLRPPLVLRNRRPGDRIRPLGAAGRKKVHDLFIDDRVPVAMRDRVPIVTDQEGILWVVGHAVAERARIRAETQEVLRIDVVTDG